MPLHAFIPKSKAVDAGPAMLLGVFRARAAAISELLGEVEMEGSGAGG